MSDRSKKIIWIAIAVSGFALVVFLTAFILFPPNDISKSKPFDLTGRSPAKPLSPNDFSAFPSIVVQSSGENAQVTDKTQTDSTNGLKPTSSVIVVPAPSVDQKTENRTPQAPISELDKSSTPSKTAPTPAQPSEKASTPPLASSPKTTTTKSSSPLPSSGAVKDSSNPPSPPTSLSNPPKASASTSEYWIQVGSFSEKGTAEKLRNEFVSRGMSTIIATKEIGSRTYYQVKVGPYASSEEAKKWLLTVKAVRGASQDAFVTTR
jgi:cell division protein FtsN